MCLCVCGFVCAPVHSPPAFFLFASCASSWLKGAVCWASELPPQLPRVSGAMPPKGRKNSDEARPSGLELRIQKLGVSGFVVGMLSSVC